LSTTIGPEALENNNQYHGRYTTGVQGGSQGESRVNRRRVHITLKNSETHIRTCQEPHDTLYNIKDAFDHAWGGETGHEEMANIIKDVIEEATGYVFSSHTSSDVSRNLS
jgi:hypothetical protein